jgi:hypothetical protein
MDLVTSFIRALRSAIYPTLFWMALILFAYYATTQSSVG